MKNAWMKNWMMVGLLAASVAGCGADAPVESAPEGEAPMQLVMPGKADDYFSTISKEFEMRGAIEVQMTEDEFNEEALREQLIAQRISAAGVYLTTYLTDKFRGIDIDGNGEIDDNEVFFNNENYGGFQAMVRNQSVEILDAELGEDSTVLVDFTIDVAGPSQLLELMLDDGAERAEGGITFGLQMPKGAATDEGGRPIRSFDPSTYEGEMETIELFAYSLPDVSDAYPHYDAFTEDGIYDITLYFGHDYNVDRWDLIEAEQAFNRLVELGYSAPVDSFEELTADSGPFRKVVTVPNDKSDGCVDRELVHFVNRYDITVSDLQNMGVYSHAARNVLAYKAGEDGIAGTVDDLRFKTAEEIDDVKYIGPVTMRKMRDWISGSCDLEIKDVDIEVRIFHSEMYQAARAEQREQALYEIVHRDVFFYNGHAGPYYGLYMDAEYGAYIDDEEFAALPFDPDRQQLFVAQGCQTYSQYADMLYASPNRDESNLDVITTVNYSYGQGTLGLFEGLTSTEGEYNHYAVSYNALISNLNTGWNQQKNVFYGVMGIDQNPSYNPYGNSDTTGVECALHAECGFTTGGNVCVGFADGTNRCVERVVSEDGCSEGTNYAYVAQEDFVLGGVCWK